MGGFPVSKKHQVYPSYIRILNLTDSDDNSLAVMPTKNNDCKIVKPFNLCDLVQRRWEVNSSEVQTIIHRVTAGPVYIPLGRKQSSSKRPSQALIVLILDVYDGSL